MTKAFAVAEIGSNWRSMGEARETIERCALAGADAVKFQWFSPFDLYGHGSKAKNMDEHEIDALAGVAETHNVEFMCTVFAPKDISRIDDLVKRHKIASSEFRHVDLVKAALKTKKPVLISTGGHTWPDIEQFWQDELKAHKKRVTLMYCCNAYPSLSHDLEWIKRMAHEFDCDVGYSDHTLDIFTPLMAVREFGATVLEKHVKPHHDMDTPDAGHSVTVEKFGDMIRVIRDGGAFPFFNSDEEDATQFHNRRLITTEAINVGDALQYGRNFGLYRSKKPSFGLSYDMIESVDGTRATRPLDIGATIDSEDFK